MRLIIARHGETELNKKRIMQGHLDGKLNDTGREQARFLAMRLKDENIDYIYSSDLSRAKDTAWEVSKFHDGKIIFTEKLRERDIGEFEGKPRDEVWPQGEPFPQPEKGENDEMLFTRVKKFYEYILDKHKNDCVLLVGHMGINLALLSLILNKTIQEILDMKKAKNTCISILNITDNVEIEVINCANHLE